MEAQLISFETARLAKYKGFNINTYYSYRKFDDHIETFHHDKNNDVFTKSSYVPAPTQSLLQKWLREKHNIHVWLIPAEVDKTYRAYVSFGIKLDLLENLRTKSFFNYEEALEDGLQEALKLIDKNIKRKL
jgi:predicted transcriptional regulator